MKEIEKEAAREKAKALLTQWKKNKEEWEKVIASWLETQPFVLIPVGAENLNENLAQAIAFENGWKLKIELRETIPDKLFHFSIDPLNESIKKSMKREKK